MSPSLPLPSSLPTPLPSTLRSAINSALLTSGGIDRIHAQLLSSLQSSGWTEAIRLYALQQFREGGKTTFGEVMEEVMRGLVEMDEEDGRKRKEKGERVVNGGDVRRLRVPEEVRREGLRVVRRELEEVVYFEQG